jgi:uncharacterized membrane protein
MTARSAADLGRVIAAVLRAGTVLAVACIVVGFGIGLVDSSDEPGAIPVLEALRRGGADALIGTGLLALTLTPPAALAAAALSLHRSGERRHATVAGIVLLLLAIGLAVAIFVAPAI